LIARACGYTKSSSAFQSTDTGADPTVGCGFPLYLSWRRPGRPDILAALNELKCEEDP
jgi:hypothetical protein